eukprot:6484722-Amphidinium_carterae.1
MLLWRIAFQAWLVDSFLGKGLDAFGHESAYAHVVDTLGMVKDGGFVFRSWEFQHDEPEQRGLYLQHLRQLSNLCNEGFRIAWTRDKACNHLTLCLQRFVACGGRSCNLERDQIRPK